MYAFVAPAKGLSPLEESAWQRGKRQADELAQGRAILFMIVSAPFFAVGGLFFVLGDVWWPLRVVLAALIGLGVALGVTLAISGFYAVRAPSKQRDEAREYARDLEAHAHAYAQWARRREIAYDFRHDTLNDLDRFRPEAEGGPILMGTLDDEETRWRGVLANIGAQMQANGSDVSAFIDAQIAFLDNADGAFEAGQLALIRNSMLMACQNLLAEIRQQGPPTAPTPQQRERLDDSAHAAAV
jgi:hypothetical protein